MKNKGIAIASTLVLAAVLVCWVVFGETWLRSAYLWIGEFENRLRGIDGMSAASHNEILVHAARHFKVLRIAVPALAAGLAVYLWHRARVRVERKDQK